MNKLAALTASEIAITDGSGFLASAAVATYPSLTELTYLKGVSSAIQTQMDLKAPLISPSFTTPAIGVATGTSLDLGGTTLLGSRSLTIDTGGVFNINMGTASGDDFTIDTSAFVVEGDTGRVGIGTVTPGSALGVFGSVSIGTGGGGGYAATSAPADGMIVKGDVGIGTTAPGNPLAVNRTADGVIVDFESADIVEGTVSISGNTTSYNAFVGSHYTQLKAGQTEYPVGAVVVSTGEIIQCAVEKESEVEVPIVDAINIVTKANAIESVDVEEDDKDVIISTDISYEYNSETGTEKEVVKNTYGKKVVGTKKQLKRGVNFDRKTRKFYTVKAGYRVDTESRKAYQKASTVVPQDNKEYFVYTDTTTIAGDKRVYGTWLGKMSDNTKGMSFGDDAKAVYLVAQVGLFKIRVTDTNGNITNGDYLESSTRAMEAQKQTSGAKKNSTIAKAMIDVDWALETTDPVLGYKWKLIPCTY